MKVVAPPKADPQERLESWKEIASFLGKGIRTVQRWERTEDLPVRRHLHERGGTVYAYKTEILEWYRSRESRLTGAAERGAESATGPVPDRHRLYFIAAPVLAATVILAVLLWPRRLPFDGLTSPFLSVAGRASQSVISPDGSQVAFVWNAEREFGNLDLYMKGVAGGPPRRLTDDPNNEHSPAWSADGCRLAFLRDNDGIFLFAPPQGGPPRRLLGQSPGAVYGVGLAWSADGKHLFFSEKRDAGAPLSIFRLSGAAVERVTAPPEPPGDMYPALSPDGQSLAFVRQSRSLAADIFLLRLRSGREPARITSIAGWIAGLAWLPDGGSIIFSSDHAGGRRLWLVRLGWRGWRMAPQPLALAGEDAYQPSVARDNERLVYSRRYWSVGIWRVDLANPSAAASPVKLIASAREDLDPAWSPDGSRIAFVSTRTGHTEIWVSRSDGSGAVQLTSFRGPLTNGPAWSPGGDSIAFSSGSSVYAIAAGGGAARKLTPEGMRGLQSAWSHDGREIYFASDQSGRDQIWAVPREGGTPRQLTSGGGTQPRPSADGRFVYFRRGGLWRISTLGGAEQQVVPGPAGSFAVGARGIYFDRGSGDYVAPEVYFHDFAGGRTSLLARFQGCKSAGLALSSNGRSLLVPLTDRQSSELIIAHGRP